MTCLPLFGPSDARNYLQRGCDAGFLHSCDSVADIDQRSAVRIDDLWTTVVEAGDDLAGQRHTATVLAQLANRPSLQRELQQLRVVSAAALTERYCPAVKAFLANASSADFTRRAVAHCRDQLPSGQGVSGAIVTLTAECQAVYATSCP